MLQMERLKADEASKAREHEILLANPSRTEGHSPAIENPRVSGTVSSTNLTKYVSREPLEPFLARFEDISTHLDWPGPVKTFQFMDLFSGQPLMITMRIDQPYRTYESVKGALLQAYSLTAEQVRKQFQSTKVQEQETAAQFVVRITNYLSLWIEKDGAENTVDSIKDLLLRTQFERSCRQDLVVQFKLGKVSTVHEMKVKAEAHFAAYGSNAYKLPKGKDDGKSSMLTNAYQVAQYGRQVNQTGSHHNSYQQNAGKDSGWVNNSGQSRGHRGTSYRGQSYRGGYQSGNLGAGNQNYGYQNGQYRQEPVRAAVTMESQNGQTIALTDNQAGELVFQASGGLRSEGQLVHGDSRDYQAHFNSNTSSGPGSNNHRARLDSNGSMESALGNLNIVDSLVNNRQVRSNA